MSYSIIEPPFATPFHEMSKTELETYAAWFHQNIPERIAELTAAVNATREYTNWTPDKSVESLDALGRWFERQVETRKRTVAEMDEIKARLPFPIDVPDEDLTIRTRSLVIDIGMYFAEVVLENLPGTRWDQPLKYKKFVDYGHPVIMGFGTVPMNPLRLLLTTASSIADGGAADLRKLYDTWAKMRTAGERGSPHV